MPLEHLEKLFEQVGQTAERLARLRNQEIAWGGRVGHSETIRSVADLYTQLHGGLGQQTPLIKAIERLSSKLEALQQTLVKQDRQTEGVAGPSVWRRLQPHRLLEPLLRFGQWTAQQEAAGLPLHPLVSALGHGSQFLYSFATGRVIMPSGRAVPWRRVVAARLRKYRWARPIRQALLSPDIAMRRIRLAWAKAQASGAMGRFVLGAGLRAGAAGAGAAGTAGVGATSAGAAGAAGAAGIGAASIAGVIAGAVVAIGALIAATITAAIALGKFTGSVRESASAALEAKRQYAITTPAIAAVLSQKEVIDLAETARRGRMLASITQAELAGYERWQAGTRNLEIFGSVLGTSVKLAMQDALRMLVYPLERVAELLNRWIGIEEEKQRISHPLQHPLLSAFQTMAKDEMIARMGGKFYGLEERGEGVWGRRKPPKPINMGPEEK